MKERLFISFYSKSIYTKMEKFKIFLKEKTKLCKKGCKVWWKEYPEEYLKLLELTSFLPKDAKLGERIWCVLNEAKKKPKCPDCGTEVKYSSSDGYAKFCSKKCLARNSEVQEKRIKTLKSYSPEIWAKMNEKRSLTAQKTMLARHNVSNIKFAHLHPSVLENLNDRAWLIQKHHTEKLNLEEIGKELGGFTAASIPKYLKKQKVEQKYYHGAPEDLKSFLLGLGKVIESNDRKILSGKELDFYFPENNLAIEYDGIYWHSFNRIETQNERYYHVEKTNACENLGIHLLHIFETEWQDPIKKEIWKSIIKSKLGMSDVKIHARKCTIKPVFYEEVYQFLTYNHLHGFVPSSVNIGLFFEDSLVMLATFSKPRYEKGIDAELIRCCSKIGVTVVGGLSKLISQTKYSSLLTYADRRLSWANSYNKIGFKVKKVTVPNYFYWEGNGLKLWSRIKFQKHKLKELLLDFDESLTEAENMFQAGYRRIWDCGNIALTIHRENVVV